jgi:hypothetical protein
MPDFDIHERGRKAFAQEDHDELSSDDPTQIVSNTASLLSVASWLMNSKSSC